MGLTLITPPVGYPVTLDDVKLNARVLHDDEDDLIEGFIAAATNHTETFTWTSLLDTTWRLTLDAFTDEIELPRGPVRSVSSVSYFDADGNIATLSASAYTVDTASYRQWIVRNSGDAWPSILSGINSVQIDYVAGFEIVPPVLKQAIIMLASYWVKNRDAAGDVPAWFDTLCAPYRRMW